MKILLSILLILLINKHSYSQTTLNNKEIKIREGCHYSGFHIDCENYPFTIQPTSTWSTNPFRTLHFSAKFDSNCNYDLGDNDQNDWNKLMKLSPIVYGKRHSNRLGWRYNLGTGQIEMAMFLHINHPVTVHDPSKRVYFPLNASDLNVFNAVELIFSNSLMVTTVGNKSVVVKEQFFTESYITGVLRNAYFGGNETAPQEMIINVENIKVDYPPGQFLQSDEKHFFRCRFYDDEILSYYGEDQIVASSHHPNSHPEESFFVVEPGSDLILMSNNEIVLGPGFHAKAGSNFHAKIGPCSDIEVSNFPTVLCHGDNFNVNITHTSYYKLQVFLPYLSSPLFESQGSINGNTLNIDLPNDLPMPRLYNFRLVLDGPCDRSDELYEVLLYSCGSPEDARLYAPQTDSTLVLLLDQPLTIYPNPTHQNIQVVGTELGEYTLYDLLGKPLIRGLKEQKQIDLNLSDLPNGIYLFTLNGRSYRVVKN